MTSTIALPHNRIIHRTVLDNGITVLVTENPSADIIAARLFFKAGSRWESIEQAGLSHLVAAVMTKGTENHSSLEIAERVESIGASLSTDAASDYFLLSIKTVSADFPEMLKLAGELLRSATFPESEVELERRLALQAIRSQQEQPFTVALDRLRHAMYGDHPYALSGLGSAETVANLKREDLQHYYQTHFRPDNLTISIAGRITPEEAVSQVEDILGSWRAPLVPLPNLNLPIVASNPTRNAVPQDTQQSIVILGYLAPSVTPETMEDYAALKLLNTYLGNGLSSRLFVELREKRGLAYEVSAFYPTRLDTSYFVTYMGTAPTNTAIALSGLKTEVDRLCDAPLSAEEIQVAKNKLLGQYALGKQTNSQLAQIFGWYETLGLGVEFDSQFQDAIAKVSAEAAQEIAGRYFGEPYISLLGPADAIESL
ncbi:processing protease [Leptolyngbya boryana NIES-2135]|uniref:Processing protease n=1 Tax=Leptolyngbya boryana NIES-2135 TaxID=1973484 RepID=A0A1Z4JGT3_LEPBY|nr:pitrilysin family protein [Leptolyngbya boryana]ULP32805.1 insulinase family protein [Leptolyngbya boryana IU 594]BAS57869.1 putative Zn-dependent peptidase [Leptolyngbya boryana IAM M-101]BAS64217.1 putative Zn-dependent peptidase [Leptolyngbya boryana dg5]BAY55930.1 processing protease [Leptolyngbya boryana NIES-2135]